MGTGNNNRSIEQEVVEVPARKVLRDRATERGNAALDDERVLSQGRAADVARMTKGRFPYNDWLIQKFNSRSEVSLAEGNYDKLQEAMLEKVLPDELKEDARTLHKIVNDIERDIRRVMDAGEVLPNEEIDRLMDRLWVCDQAKSVLIQANKSIDIARNIGAFSLIGGLIAFGIYGNIAMHKHHLNQLKALLEEAKRQTRNVKIKQALNTSISVITMVVPQLGVGMRIGLLVGQLLVDEVLGDPSASSRIMTTTGHATKAYDQLENVPSQTKVIAREAGKAIQIIGFTFAVKDLGEALANEEEIEKLMKIAEEEFKNEVLPKIAIMKNNLKMLIEETLPELRMELAQNKLEVGSAREELRSRMRETGYMP